MSNLTFIMKQTGCFLESNYLVAARAYRSEDQLEVCLLGPPT